MSLADRPRLGDFSEVFVAEHCQCLCSHSCRSKPSSFGRIDLYAPLAASPCFCSHNSAAVGAPSYTFLRFTASALNLHNPLEVHTRQRVPRPLGEEVECAKLVPAPQLLREFSFPWVQNPDLQVFRQTSRICCKTRKEKRSFLAFG